MNDDNSQAFSTFLTTGQGYLGLYTTGCRMCSAPSQYKLGNTGKVVSNDMHTFVADVYNYTERFLEHGQYGGQEISDDFKITFRAQNRSTSISSNFTGITYVHYEGFDNVYQYVDGFVGIAPYTASSDKNYNFMY